MQVIDAKLLERLLNEQHLVFAHEAGIDQQSFHAATAQDFVEQHECHRGIHAAGHQHEHLSVTDIALDLFGNQRCIAIHGPGCRLAQIRKVLEHGQPVFAVSDFGVELQCVNTPCFIGEPRIPTGLRGSDARKALRQLAGLVAMGHPDRALLRHTGKDLALLSCNCNWRFAVLLYMAGCHLAAQCLSDPLQAVAQTKHRDVEIENFRVCLGAAFVVHALRPTGQNDTSGTGKLRRRGFGSADFGVVAEAADAAGN